MAWATRQWLGAAALGLAVACTADLHAGSATDAPILEGETLYDKTQAYVSYNYDSRSKILNEREKISVDGIEFSEHRMDIGGIFSVPEYGRRGTLEHLLAFDWTLSLVQPVIARSYTTPDVIQPAMVGASFDPGMDASYTALGDLALYIRRRYLRWSGEDRTRRALHLSGVVGFTFPTGSTSLESDGVELARGMQPGTGSFGLTASHLFSLEFNQLEFFATTTYARPALGGDDYEFGDSFVEEGRVAYRFYQEEYPGQSFSAKTGVRFEAQATDTFNGAEVHNTGGRYVDVLGGLLWQVWADNATLGGGLDFALVGSLPVFQDVNGVQTAREFGVELRASFRFTSLHR